MADIQAHLADGRILHFPDGTNPDVVQSAVRKTLGVQASDSAPGVPSGLPQPESSNTDKLLGFAGSMAPYSEAFGKGFGETMHGLGAKAAEAPEAVSALFKKDTKPATASGMVQTAANAYESLPSQLNPFSLAPARKGQNAGQRIAESAGMSAPQLGLMAGGGEDVGLGEDYFQKNLRATAHDILTRSANNLKAKLWDAYNGVSRVVGQHINNIATADYQSGKPSISIADIWKDVESTAEKYNADGKATPKFAAASQSILNRGNPYLSWKELHDIKTELGSAWNRTADGTPDSAAMNDLREKVDQKLGQRADDLGHGEQYKAYNDLWSTLQKYRREGVLGKLLNAPTGKTFFDIARDSGNKAALQRTMNSLEPFGLDKDAITDAIKQHEPLVKYVTPMGGGGKVKAIMSHPIAAGAGYMAGRTVGGWPGGIAGALGAAGMVDRIKAVNAMRALGGAPSLAGEMESAAKVMPKGSGEIAQAPESFAAEGNSAADVASALKELGFKPADATKAAMSAMQKHPGNFDAALREALSARRR